MKKIRFYIFKEKKNRMFVAVLALWLEFSEKQEKKPKTGCERKYNL